MKLGRVGVSSLVKGGCHPPRKTLPSPHSVNHSPMNEDRPSFTVRLREKLVPHKGFHISSTGGSCKINPSRLGLVTDNMLQAILARYCVDLLVIRLLIKPSSYLLKHHCC